MNDAIGIPDEKLHTGHRARMRRKLLTYGTNIFDTYELLEMLLYYAIPYKDTNPIAKRLLMEFGSLDGVLSASPEELARVSGVGKRAAELLITVGKLPDVLYYDNYADSVIYNDYDKAGKHFVKYFEGNKKRSVAVMLLDNGMRELDTVTVYEDVIYGSAGVKAAPFLNQAILSGASVIITAHNRPHGPTTIISEDAQTNKMIDMAFEQAGIAVAEHYAICGNIYIGTRELYGFSVGTETELDKFRRSREIAAIRGEEKG